MIDLEHLSHAGRAHVAFGVSSVSSHTALALILRFATPISQELTLLAKRAARKVSWKLLSAGFRFTSISVLEFPPEESGWGREDGGRGFCRVCICMRISEHIPKR
jgi:hypothetical protein